MTYYYIKTETFDSFSNVFPDRLNPNKYIVYIYDIPIILKEYLNPTFFKTSDELYIEYKYFGYESLGYQRKMLFRQYISIDELQIALDNYLGYQHKIVNVEIHNQRGFSPANRLVIFCEENVLVSKIQEMKESLSELELKYEDLEQENKDLNEKNQVLRNTLSKIGLNTKNILKDLDELDL